MGKSLWIMLAVMVVAVGAPSAHADSFTYSYTALDGISFTTAAIPGITMATTVPASDLTASANTGMFAGCVTSSVILDAGGFGNTTTFFTDCFTSQEVNGDGFTVPEYNAAGTYVDSFTGDTLVVKSAPEPSSVALMLLGVGFVFVCCGSEILEAINCLRKRFLDGFLIPAKQKRWL